MRKTSLLIASILLLWNAEAYAFNSTSDGSLGAFTPISTATHVTLPANGKLNYTTINIPSGVTVTFVKNAANTPVYMLASGNVTINGTINVNGTDGISVPGQGGPGGFDGGYAGTQYDPGGKGLGPGGGYPGTFNGNCSTGFYSPWNVGGGGFGTLGGTRCGAGGGTYGNERLLPLIGGSGGGGQGGPPDFSSTPAGGGGGGAILIASSGTIYFNGSITANGGSAWPGGGGSGGGVKLMANAIYGNGSITAAGGGSNGNNGGAGRIRLEAITNASIITSNPDYSYDQPGNVFVPNTPTLTITSIGGTPPPPNPTGSYSQPDIMLPSTTTNPVSVNISAAYVPIATTVKVWVIPKHGNATSVDMSLSGTDQSSTGTANVNLSTTYSNIVTAEATFTIVAFNYEGEEIDRVRVATRLGGQSEITYIAKSGKEFKGELLASLVK